jgi:hypothetical protein
MDQDARAPESAEKLVHMLLSCVLLQGLDLYVSRGTFDRRPCMLYLASRVAKPDTLHFHRLPNLVHHGLRPARGVVGAQLGEGGHVQLAGGI